MAKLWLSLRGGIPSTPCRAHSLFRAGKALAEPRDDPNSTLVTITCLLRADKALAESSRLHSLYTLLRTKFSFVLAKPWLSLRDYHHSSPTASTLPQLSVLAKPWLSLRDDHHSSSCYRTGKALAEPLRPSSPASQSLTPVLIMHVALARNYHFRIWMSLQDWTWTWIGAAYRRAVHDAQDDKGPD